MVCVLASDFANWGLHSCKNKEFFYFQSKKIAKKCFSIEIIPRSSPLVPHFIITFARFLQKYLYL
jgi:hypothetical protein